MLQKNQWSNRSGKVWYLSWTIPFLDAGPMMWHIQDGAHLLNCPWCVLSSRRSARNIIWGLSGPANYPTPIWIKPSHAVKAGLNWPRIAGQLVLTQLSIYKTAAFGWPLKDQATQNTHTEPRRSWSSPPSIVGFLCINARISSCARVLEWWNAADKDACTMFRKSVSRSRPGPVPSLPQLAWDGHAQE